MESIPTKKPLSTGRSKTPPRYNVISIRVSEDERTHLDTLVELNRKSVSDIMREALEYYVARDDRK